MQSDENESFSSRVRDFDSDWRFMRDSIAGAEQPGYNDSGWRVIDLPHDWSIEDLPEQIPGETIGPFSKKSEGANDGNSTGHVVGGTGWYRKAFTLTSDDKGKIVSVYFEGAYTETDVWINGNYVGDHKHGYTSFSFDITKFCKPAGEKNVLAVRVVNKGKNSRWYSGSGIYRHVKLIVTNPLHIDQWGVYVTTPKISAREATVRVVTDILNQQDAKIDLVVHTRILDANGTRVVEADSRESIGGNDITTISQDMIVKSPQLWSTDSPYLYKAEVTVRVGGKTEDITLTNFGIREISFSAENGFVLNGKNIKLKGGCVHHDNGILGAVAIDRAEERRIELLKANGFNAVRSSHCPPSEKFLEACDRLGILVIDEAFDMWQKPKNPDDYHQFFDKWWRRDLSSMILRDRNHPSIILWSIGNEIQERADLSGLNMIEKFKPVIRQLDPSRLITSAVCEFWDNPGKKWGETAPTFALLDVGGYNYQWWQYESDHKQYPNRIMVGTESVPQHAFENWQLVEKNPYVIGDFVWTAMDYLGESGIGHSGCDTAKDNFFRPWPWFNAWCGDIDLIGDKKPQSYYRDVVWRRSKIQMAVHPTGGCKEKISYWGWPDEQQSWTFPGHDGMKFEVNVYSRSPLVRLELNGRIIGEKTIPDSAKLTAKFEVPYESGELKAIAIEDGKEVGQVSLKTAGNAHSIRLKADRTSIRASRNDLSYVTVEITDDKGNLVPWETRTIEFNISGAGELAGVGSANPSDMASFKQPKRNTFRGKCLVVLRPKGEAGDIILEAKAGGLQPARIVISTKN
ncbi:MAG TPA: glycoside hydrolase family 2 TIM barrel-domain containing protein [Chitinophagaceae bacterium]|nr:glycoside hydrolase family 2 TIM barrel-domain containing protein [Chitinophagaceae bacterium]